MAAHPPLGNPNKCFYYIANVSFCGIVAAPSEENGMSQRRLILALAACQQMLVRNLRTLYGLRDRTYFSIHKALTRLASGNLVFRGVRAVES